MNRSVLQSFASKWRGLIGQSHDFWRAYSLFVASFAPWERSEGANDVTTETNKLYARQKSCDDYYYYQYTRPNRTNLFHKERLFNMKSCCGLQIPFTARTLPFAPRKGAFWRGQFVIWRRDDFLFHISNQCLIKLIY